jgi:hypothetical protein
MSDQAEGLCLHKDARMATFAQTTLAPVQHAVQASTTAANMASELAGQYAGIQEDLLRTFNADTAAHHASEFARTEALQQAQVSRHNLDFATAAMTQVRHENASSMAQTETLAKQMAFSQLRQRARPFTEEELPPVSTSPSEFGSWFSTLLGSPVHPHVRSDSRPASPTSVRRQPSPERNRVLKREPPSGVSQPRQVTRRR